MVDVEKIKSDIDALNELTAEEYCKEQVAKIYADFEASRDKKIADLETALKIYEDYQIKEAEDQEDADASLEKVEE